MNTRDTSSSSPVPPRPVTSSSRHPCAAWLVHHAGSNPWGQVVALPIQDGHELRHAADLGQPAANLLHLAPAALREWADTAQDGSFRPLKSAPNLRPGWRCLVTNHDELELALHGLYPGALGDWWALVQDAASPTSFEAFVGRQSGIYRAAHHLPATEAIAITQACCHPASCLKDRRWSAGHVLPPASGQPSGCIPCWQPCALALDMARVAARIAAEPPVTLQLAPQDVAVLRAALASAAALPPPPLVRDADLGNPSNPRRIRLLLERLRPEWTRLASPPEA